MSKQSLQEIHRDVERASNMCQPVLAAIRKIMEQNNGIEDQDAFNLAALAEGQVRAIDEMLTKAELGVLQHVPGDTPDTAQTSSGCEVAISPEQQAALDALDRSADVGCSSILSTLRLLMELNTSAEDTDTMGLVCLIESEVRKIDREIQDAAGFLRSLKRQPMIEAAPDSAEWSALHEKLVAADFRLIDALGALETLRTRDFNDEEDQLACEGAAAVLIAYVRGVSTDLSDVYDRMRSLGVREVDELPEEEAAG